MATKSYHDLCAVIARESDGPEPCPNGVLDRPLSRTMTAVLMGGHATKAIVPEKGKPVNV